MTAIYEDPGLRSSGFAVLELDLSSAPSEVEFVVLFPEYSLSLAEDGEKTLTPHVFRSPLVDFKDGKARYSIGPNICYFIDDFDLVEIAAPDKQFSTGEVYWPRIGLGDWRPGKPVPTREEVLQAHLARHGKKPRADKAKVKEDAVAPVQKPERAPEPSPPPERPLGATEQIIDDTNVTAAEAAKEDYLKGEAHDHALKAAAAPQKVEADKAAPSSSTEARGAGQPTGIAYRLGRALYWVCAGLGLLWLSFWLFIFGSVAAETGKAPEDYWTLFILLLPAFFAYGLGWLFRYVLAGGRIRSTRQHRVKKGFVWGGAIATTLLLLVGGYLIGQQQTNAKRVGDSVSKETSKDEARLEPDMTGPSKGQTPSTLYRWSLNPSNVSDPFRNRAAGSGDASVQVKRGWAYANGEGVPQDYAEAARWYRKAAEQGLSLAQHNLAVMYHFGYGVRKDPAEAMKWYRKAAQQGVARSQLLLGDMYAKGQGVDQNYTEAMKWYVKAAERGDLVAQKRVEALAQSR